MLTRSPRALTRRLRHPTHTGPPGECITGKTTFACERAAVWYAGWLRRMSRISQCPYQCSECNGWHLTQIGKHDDERIYERKKNNHLRQTRQNAGD